MHSDETGYKSVFSIIAPNGELKFNVSRELFYSNVDHRLLLFPSISGLHSAWCVIVLLIPLFICEFNWVIYW